MSRRKRNTEAEAAVTEQTTPAAKPVMKKAEPVPEPKPEPEPVPVPEPKPEPQKAPTTVAQEQRKKRIRIRKKTTKHLSVAVLCASQSFRRFT